MTGTSVWTHHQAVVAGHRTHFVTAGTGPALVLLHGWPQTWYEWRKVIPALAERFTVVAPDLRGLGDNDRPAAGYDKQTVAADVRELLRQLGHERVGVIAHDWGGPVAYNLAYHHPEVVEKLYVLDTVPALLRADEPVSLAMAMMIDHIFFHGSHPERAAALVAHDVDGYLRRFLTSLDYNYSPAVFDESEIAEYVRANSQPGAILAGFQWYAAGLREDAEAVVGHDRKLTVPVLAQGGSHFLGDIRPQWQRYCELEVQGGAVERCGHFIAEERPEVVIESAEKFFS